MSIKDWWNEKFKPWIKTNWLRIAVAVGAFALGRGIGDRRARLDSAKDALDDARDDNQQLGDGLARLAEEQRTAAEVCGDLEELVRRQSHVADDVADAVADNGAVLSSLDGNLQTARTELERIDQIVQKYDGK